MNTTGRVKKHVAVAKLTVGKHRNRGERCAATHPAQKDAHLELAHVEFQIARKPAMALFRRQRDDFDIDTLRLHRAVDQEARSVIFVAG